MQNKDSKKVKNTNNQNNNSNPNNKILEDYFLINKLIPKNKYSKMISNNNSNANILRVKTLEKSNINTNNQNKVNKSNTVLENIRQSANGKEKEKKNKNIYMPLNIDKIGSDKKTSKARVTKTKTPINLEVNKKSKITNKNTGINDAKKNPFFKNKDKDNINYNDKRKKSDNGYYNSKTEPLDDKKENNNKKDELFENEDKSNGIGTQKFLEFLVSLTPIDTSKCEELINNNMNKIIELENKISEIVKMTQNEIAKISNDDINGKRNKDNKISTEQNIEIINIESSMRKKIYITFFYFITQLLGQINQLSNNIANQDINNLNIMDISSSNNDLFINNTNMGNNSLFVSNIEEEFCEKLFNITKSFVSSDIDLADLNSNYNGNIVNFSNGGKIVNIPEEKDFNLEDDNFSNDNDDDNKIINYNNNEYNVVSKSKSKKLFKVHPNEILDKIHNEDKKDRKVLHHYSNSLKVNSNLEKLEGKINNDDDNLNSDTIESLGNLEKFKNCNIF